MLAFVAPEHLWGESAVLPSQWQSHEGGIYVTVRVSYRYSGTCPVFPKNRILRKGS